MCSSDLLAMPDELDHFRVWDRGRLPHHFVRAEKLCAPSAVADKQLAINEIVAEHFIVGQKPVEFAGVRFGSSQKTDPDRCIDKNHLYTATPARRFFSTPRYVARGRIGAPQSAKALIGGMADKRLESHPYGFGVCGSPADGARLMEELFVNVESLLHMDDLAILFHPKQPDEQNQRDRVRAGVNRQNPNLFLPTCGRKCCDGWGRFRCGAKRAPALTC